MWRITLLLGVLPALLGCQDRPPVGLAQAAPRVRLLQCSPQILDFGIVHQSGQKLSQVTLRNLGVSSVGIVRIDSTCPCLTAGLKDQAIAAGSELVVEIRLDLREEPEFLGGLRMELTGRTADGEVAFSLTATTEVIKVPAS